jgi:hypothetical protein
MPDELSNDVARHFETEWQNYDQQIRRTIPFYDDALDPFVAVVAGPTRRRVGSWTCQCCTPRRRRQVLPAKR